MAKPPLPLSPPSPGQRSHPTAPPLANQPSELLLTRHPRHRPHCPCRPCPHPRCPHRPRALVVCRRLPSCSCPPPAFAAPLASWLLSFYPSCGFGISKILASAAVVANPPLCLPSLSPSLPLHCRCAFHWRRVSVAPSIAIAIAPSIAVIAIALPPRCPSPLPLRRLLPSLPLCCHRAFHCRCIAVAPSIAVAVAVEPSITIVAIVSSSRLPSPSPSRRPSPSPSRCDVLVSAKQKNLFEWGVRLEKN